MTEMTMTGIASGRNGLFSRSSERSEVSQGR